METKVDPEINKQIDKAKTKAACTFLETRKIGEINRNGMSLCCIDLDQAGMA